MEAEDRILIAVGKVEKKVDVLTGEFNKDKLKTAVAIAEIKQLEARCPIDEVENTLREVKTTSDQNRRDMSRLAAMIAGGITVVMGGIHFVVDWFKGN